MSSTPLDWRLSPLLTDLYQLTMLQGYFRLGLRETAVFELFMRRLPEGRNFMLAAGLEQALEYLETLRFSAEEIDALRATGLFTDDFLAWLGTLRFTGDVDAVPEGTVCFANEPLLRVVAPLPEAQLVESRLVNLIHFQTLIASKAARCVLAARGKRLVDFGMRRAHGAEASVLAARASYVAGFDGTATVLAAPLFGIPVFGTMAHSFIEAHDSEVQAFENFARVHRGAITLLIDTYDTEEGARRVVEIAPRLARDGIRIHSVRLDSGDLLALSRAVRRILDDGGQPDIGIFASGGLDERRVQALLEAGAPIDGFGIGTALDVSEDVPALDCVYKLQEYGGKPRLKRSPGKETWPGRKQVFRQVAADGRLERDVVTLATDRQPGEPLLEPVMRGGRRLAPSPSLAAIRARAAQELARLPPAVASLAAPAAYPVTIAPALQQLRRELERSL
ncbi:MAG TPA: nicotinate phosphoribosyltransferase [Gammaproteobacteria bacterium]